MDQLPKNMQGFENLFNESDTTLSLEEDRISEYETSENDKDSSIGSEYNFKLKVNKTVIRPKGHY